jgi:hypothetical protein
MFIGRGQDFPARPLATLVTRHLYIVVFIIASFIISGLCSNSCVTRPFV